MSQPYSNHLYVWDDRFLYITPGITSGITQRHTTTLLVSLDGTGFELGDAAGRRQRYQAALVGRQVARALDSAGSPLLSLNFDPQSYEFHTLSAFLAGQSVRAVILRPDALNAAELDAAGHGTLDKASLFRITTHLVQAISGYSPKRVPMDMRAVYLAQTIKQELPLVSSVSDLAQQVGLSADRLTHLFSENLGLSVKSYILWARMRRAVELIAQQESLANIAHDVGFSDSAHLARTFRQFFGLPPSYVANGMTVHML
ncbi:helix-turn-helix transcriptional regulator [Alcanivorax sp. JB21]|nr:helix-turn-helix transcriptional regulator [Alcanivorax limicola]